MKSAYAPGLKCRWCWYAAPAIPDGGAILAAHVVDRHPNQDQALFAEIDPIRQQDELVDLVLESADPEHQSPLYW